MRKLLDTLAAVLDDAVEDDHIDRNPARSKRLRLRVPKPPRTFLEMDELAALIDAAQAHDGPLARPPSATASSHPTARRVGEAIAAGRTPRQIAAELAIAKSTVSYHSARIEAPPYVPYAGRRAIAEILGRSGLQVGHVPGRPRRLQDDHAARGAQADLASTD